MHDGWGLKLKPIIAAKAKDNQRLSKGRGEKGGQNSAHLKDDRRSTAQVAKIAGVSRDTVHKAEVIEQKADEDA